MPYKDHEKQKEYWRAYRSKNPERIAELKRMSQKKRRDADLEKARAKERASSQEYFRKYPHMLEKKMRGKRARIYSLTSEQYDDLTTSPHSRCYLCEKKDQRLVIDHCHVTGLNRGVLCSNCNAALGKMGDNAAGVRKALLYLLDFEALFGNEEIPSSDGDLKSKATERLFLILNSNLDIDDLL